MRMARAGMLLRNISEASKELSHKLSRLLILTSVRKVDVNALWADNLKTIYMEGPEPPEMTGNVRDDEWIYNDVDLFVPCGSEALYKKAPGWKCFKVKEY